MTQLAFVLGPKLKPGEFRLLCKSNSDVEGQLTIGKEYIGTQGKMPSYTGQFMLENDRSKGETFGYFKRRFTILEECQDNLLLLRIADKCGEPCNLSSVEHCSCRAWADERRRYSYDPA